MKTFYAKIRLSNGAHQVITVTASDISNARQILETQFGAGSILSGPSKTKPT